MDLYVLNIQKKTVFLWQQASAEHESCVSGTSESK